MTALVPSVDSEHYSVASKSTAKASELFTDEQRRQRENVGRIEKIEVRYLGLPHDTTLVMNRELSTPYDCARRKYFLQGLDWAC